MEYETKITRAYLGYKFVEPHLSTLNADSIDDAKKQLSKEAWKLELASPSVLVMSMLIKQEKGWLNIRTGVIVND